MNRDAPQGPTVGTVLLHMDLSHALVGADHQWGVTTTGELEELQCLLAKRAGQGVISKWEQVGGNR